MPRHTLDTQGNTQAAVTMHAAAARDHHVTEASLQREWQALETAAEREPAPLTKAHWARRAERAACARCAVHFDFLTAGHWCHCCGEIFCRPCVSKRRRLSTTGQPDPYTGTFYPVCERCYATASVTQSLGQMRTHTAGILERRRRWSHRRSDSGLRAACHRLGTAFASQSALKRSLSSIAMVAPVWSKVNWVDARTAQSVSVCPVCSRRFSLLIHRHFCRLCGLVHCADCLLSSLLVSSVPSDEVSSIRDPGDVRKPTGEKHRTKRCKRTKKG